MSKKERYSKEKVLEDNLSDGYTNIEKKEIVDLICLRDKWNFDIKRLQSSFDLTYGLEHG